MSFLTKLFKNKSKEETPTIPHINTAKENSK